MFNESFQEWIENLRRWTVSRGGMQKVDEVDGSEIWMRSFWDHPEGRDPLLTIKRIPAWAMLANGFRRGLIDRETSLIITASSGNFLYELGILATKISREDGFDLRVLGFVPYRIPRKELDIILNLGIDVVKVETEQDLCPREATVMAERRFASTRRDAYNADQYISHENPWAHQVLTARVLDEEMQATGFRPHRILVATGTGGTMGGLTTYFHLVHQQRTKWPEISGVQPPVKHHVLGVHHITIEQGCRWNPETYTALLGNRITTVDDADAYAAMVKLAEKGIRAGPSTGMVYHQALLDAGRGEDVLIISADNDLKYDDWTFGVLSGQVGSRILSRYPEMEDAVAKYLERVRNRSRTVQMVDRIRRIYKAERQGRVTTYEEFLASNYSFGRDVL